MELNKIYNGDTRELIKQVESESIDLIVSDIPYTIIQGGDAKGFWRDRQMGGVMAKHGFTTGNYELVKKGKIFEHNDIKFHEYLPELYRVLKQSSHCYLMINARNLKELQQACEDAGLIYQQLLVWDKRNATPNRYYTNACEFILMLRKGAAKNINDMGARNLISVPNIIGTKRHPTEKPVVLMEYLIKQSSKQGDLVLDPFCGSGSTCLAAKNTGRNYIGFEIDQNYHEIACKRMTEPQKVSLFNDYKDGKEKLV